MRKLSCLVILLTSSLLVTSRYLGSKKDFHYAFDQCAIKCSKGDAELQQRLANWDLIFSDADRCYVGCGWGHVGKLTPDGKADVPSIVEQFTIQGLEVPKETYDLENLGIDDFPKLVNTTLNWLILNKEVCKKAFFNKK